LILEFIKIVTLGFFSFTMTNLDNFLLLLCLFSLGTISIHKIILGQFLGMSAILILSYLGGSAALVLFSAKWTGIFGIVPLFIGLKSLYEIRVDSKNQNKSSIPFFDKRSSNGGVINVAFLTLANGGDNIAIYSGLFAERSELETFFLIFIFLILTGVWCVACFFLSSQKKWETLINRFKITIFPFAMILMGCSILFKLV
jgi:cadmium resistance protein CadD (predicted permease)